MYYHGITNILPIKNYILPSTYTNILREDRTKNTNYVFATQSVKSAQYYAKLACNKFGGKPIVYEIRLINEVEGHNGEWLCDKAKILKIKGVD